MTRLLLPLVGGLPLLHACVDTGVTSFNASPVIVILSHLDGDQVRANELLTLRAGASDPDNSPETLEITWFVNEEEACPTALADTDGVSICEIALSEDETDIRVEVRDPNNAASSVRVTLDVLPTQAPQAYIVSPELGVAYYSDQLIAFQGLVLDWEDLPAELTAWWELDGVGDLGLDATPDDQGGTIDFGTLDEGEHAILLHVTDSEGRTAFDSVIIEVGAPNSPPDCQITSPGDGSSGELGVELVLEGLASDPDVAPDRLTASWTSDQDGYLGQSVPDSTGALSLSTATLSAGTHAITLAVTDDVGATCGDVVLFSVGGPPSVSLDNPVLGSLFSDAESVLFSATVSDVEDRAQDLGLSWVSSLQGEFNTDSAASDGQAAFVVSDLSVGTHDVTLTVTDSDGLYTRALTTLTIDGLPSQPAVALAPDPATTSDDLVASITADSVDPEGGAISYSWAWTVDGVASTASTTETLSTADTARGETWKVFATPSDGVLDGPAGEAELVIDNTAPSVASAVLTPDPAAEGDTLTCTPGATSDADGDAVATTVSWSVEGVSLTGLGSTLDGSYFDRGESVFCSVTPDDGTDSGGAVDSNTVVIGNSAPSVTSVAISPDPPVAGDVLTCTASGFSDPDGDADATAFSWLLNGTADGTGATYAGAFVRGDVVTCDATPSDGTDTGTVVSASVTVDNTAPTLAGASISPDPASPTDTLTCSWSGFSDADGDSDLSTVDWSVAGTTVGTATTLSGVFVKGDAVTCTVTPSDGLDVGPPVTAVVTVGNTAPVVTGVSISPASPQTDDLLTASASATDADGDAVALAYDWTVDGVYAGSGSTLDGAVAFDRDQSVQVEVTPNDGSEDGTTTASSAVTVLNTAPSVAAVSLSPSAPQAGDSLSCSYSGYADADGDTDSSTMTWSLAGTTVGTGAAYPGTPASGDVITCAVTPHDGTDVGTDVTATVTVDNTAPGITSVTISPDPATASDALSCTYAGFSDPDGDPDASTLAWTVGGTTVGTGSTLSTGYARGDLVTCTVTPSDGSDTGTALSDSLTIANTAPVLSAVSLSPASPGTDDTLVVSTSTSDADGDTVSVSVDWYVDGVYATSGSSSLAGGTWFDKGQDVHVEVTPSDGTDAGSSLTSSAVTVVNTAPSVSAVSVSPDPPSPSDTLVCSYTGYTDADGDADASTFAWDVSGVSAGSGASLSGGFADGDWVTCTVTPDDGSDTGTAVTASVLVGNSAPSIGSVAITPDPAVAGDTLTCAYSGYSDPEGDADASTIAWDVGGTAVGSGSTLSTGFGRDDLVTCTVTPSDGTDTGTAVTDSVVIDNTAPGVSAVGISPSSAFTDDTLTASASTSDADGDSVSLSYDWTVDGTYVSTGATLAGATHFDKDQVIEVTATPTDGTDAGTSLTSGSLTILNSAPSITSATILPTAPAPGDTLTCGANGYSDADGDPSASTISWDIGGTTVGTGSSYAGTLADGDVVTCTITPSDGTDTGTAVTDTVTVSSTNTAPTVSAVSITPSSPQTNDVLTASASTSDPDGDTVTVTYDWSVDGVYASTGATLDGATAFDRGQVVDVTATPSDGTDVGAAVSAGGVTVINTAPTVASASISPATATDSDTLTCSGNGFSDADGDSDVSTFAWDVGGTSVGTGATLAGAFVDGDTVTCTLTPDDGTDTGTAVSASVTIGSSNTPPVVTALAISPSSATTGDTLTASASTSDADGDTVTVTYDWSVDGSYVWTGGTLDGATFFDRDQDVTVVATPHDGTEVGSSVTSAALTIDNTAPSLSSASVSPATATTADTLTCSGNGFSDADGDSDVSTFAWDIRGTTVGMGTTLAGAFSDGDTVTCTITPHDGTDAGTTVSAGVTIGSSNTQPSITTISVTPSNPLTDDVLTVSSSTFDADGDTVTVSYDWLVDGTSVATGTTLDGATWFDKGQTVDVVGTPNDGTEDGSSVSPSTLTVGNSAPAILSASVSPSSPTTTDTLTCAAVGYSDADGDADASSFDWAVNGTSVSSGATLTGGLADGDLVTCTITPDDGTDTGSDVSATVTVGTSANNAPSISAVVISPSTAFDGDTLTCTYSGYSDADGDPDASFMAWTVNGVSAGSSSSLSGAFGRDDSVVCTVTPFDGLDTGTALSDAVIISNTAPVVGAAFITPSSPGTDSVLTASASTTDADGDSVSVVYDWYVDGTFVSSGSSTLDGATAFDKGQSVYVEATPDDGTDFGTAVSSSVVTVGNTAPEITTVAISPDPATPSDTLICSYGGYSDADGDADSSSIAWDVGGSPAGTGSSLSGAFVDGDTVTCTVTPSDGTDSGTARSDAIAITADPNTPPQVTAVTISPSSPDTDDVLTASASTTDADGDTVTVTYDWDVDGGYVYTGTTLDGATFFDRDQTVDVTATPHDGTEFGTAMSASTVTVVNSAPTDPAISISPSSPTEGTDDLICAIDTASTDADGDSISYTFSWSVDGLAYPAGDTADTATWTGPDTTIYTDDTVPGVDTLDGETWVCTVTADDGTDSSNSISTFVTVGAGAATDYSDTWTLDTTVSYSCAFGLVSLSFNQVIITDSNPTIIVADTSAQPGSMAGTFSTSVDWSAQNVLAGSCTETYTMTGTFTDANTFTALFEADYTPTNPGDCLGCTYQSWTVTGTR